MFEAARVLGLDLSVENCVRLADECVIAGFPGGPYPDQVPDRLADVYGRRDFSADAHRAAYTLYAHFRTKNELVVAALEHQHHERRASLEAHLRDRAELSARERLLSVFDWIEGHQRSAWARGCPFVNASVELGSSDNRAARRIVRQHKAWFRAVLGALAAQAGAVDPAALGSRLHLLIEGANARMLGEADRGAIQEARRAALVLVDEATGSARVVAGG